MKVLIIEPDANYAAALSHIVGAAGHQALIRCDPTEAIQAADEYSPDLILLGMSLKGLDIYRYTRTLRKQDHLDHVKIVAVSGEVDDPDDAREAGIDTELLRSHSRGLLVVMRHTLQQVADEKRGGAL